MDEGRYHRQELFFGKEGQERLAKCAVAIVGLGGLGSHVVQQLAYLGVGSFFLVDHDTVTHSNLNRVIGATEADVGCRKVEVASRVIGAVLPGTQVETACDTFIKEEVFRRLQAVNFVFGCVDNDASRLVLNEFCQAYSLSYIDIATGMNPEDNRFGGRILFSDGRACLVCKDLLDDAQIRDAVASARERQEEERIYGVRRRALGEVGPAVVSLNGIMAAVAVTEFMVEVTGVRRAQVHLEYKGEMGILVRDETPPDFDCYYCKRQRGKESAADVERYIREGWGRRLMARNTTR